MAELQGGCPEEGTVSREVGFVQVATRWDARWGLKAGRAACAEVLGGGAVCYGSFQRWAEVYGRAVGREQTRGASRPRDAFNGVGGRG